MFLLYQTQKNQRVTEITVPKRESRRIAKKTGVSRGTTEMDR